MAVVKQEEGERKKVMTDRKTSSPSHTLIHLYIHLAVLLSLINLIGKTADAS